ncbi:WAT1-related protein At3g02690, chloroplastic isoform X1 [Populus nigra]|uniref:WAT1-related protein At3g02690, chloroplastic isoform X1 n=1 Tax=Populus nigra TaxID=3691 RepID=UPI002B27982A|nr:WAT1-related protein At3g02690, chloroplastic isoform X1 [Populus nigra]
MEGSLSLFSASSLTNCSILLPTASASLSLSHPHFSYDYPLKFPHLSQRASPNHAFSFPFSPSSSSSTTTNTCQRSRSRHANFISKCSTSSSRKAELEFESSSSQPVDDGGDLDCVGTGLDSECLVSEPNLDAPLIQLSSTEKGETATESLIETITETAVLVSPFFFWGTSMVAMKEVLPLTGPFFVSSFRLIPAGLLLVAFAGFKGRLLPSGLTAWLAITLFALVDASCFQGFLAQGLQRTSAGLGSVIIDSQPLTVAILANLLFGESIGIVGASGLVLGVIGLLLLEVPTLTFDESNFSLWGSGEWWMLLAAQSMAVGTVMVRWVSKYSDPVMATGWHMVIGGLPLLAISVLNHDPAFSLSLKDLTASDILALLYTSIFGSAISYGVYFYSATKGSLTKLSSLTFLTPMFASIFGFLYLGETFSPLQLAGAIVTVVAIYMVNYRNSNE